MDDMLRSYADELKLLIQKGYDSYEKQLNYISAGALGISMLFVEKVVDIQSSLHNWILILSWTAFSLTLVSNLLSHIFTAKTHNNTLAEIYSNEYDYEKAVKRNKKIERWNLFSIAFLFLGIICQILFISINI